jgi:acylpyruvate hydrolase
MVLGPSDHLICPPSVGYLGCHVDVGAVVGRPRRTGAPRGGDGAIFGYTVMVRWFGRTNAGSNLDEDPLPFATSLGPSIVTPDELDLAGTVATVGVDGEVVATSRLRPDGRVAALIARAVRDDDADPGDVFASTAFGASFELTLDRAAAAGAMIEVNIEGIGSLATRVGR